MNVQRCPVRYTFKLGHNAAEATKNICCKKSEDAVDHSNQKTFRLGRKTLDDQTNSGWPKTMDSEADLQAIEANPVSSTRRVSIQRLTV